MRALGEDPEAFAQLHEELAEAYAPPDAIARGLVEDLAKLYWRQRRWERALDGLLRAERKQWELDQEARAHGQPSRAETISRDYFARHGMRWHSGPAAQVERLAELLSTVRQRVEERNFSEDLEWIFELLYGETPPHRGQLIWFLWRYVQAAQSSGKPVPETACEVLKRQVDEEIAALRESAELGERARQELASAERDARLMPHSPQWVWMIQQGNAFDRAIDRKIRLLLQYQKQKAGSQRRDPEARSQKTEGKAEVGRMKAERGAYQETENGEVVAGQARPPDQEPAHTEPRTLRIKETNPRSALESTHPGTRGSGSLAKEGGRMTRDE
jgi:hypothetical protein